MGGYVIRRLLRALLTIFGVLTIAFIWARPVGILPERRPRYGPSS